MCSSDKADLTPIGKKVDDSVYLAVDLNRGGRFLRSRLLEGKSYICFNILAEFELQTIIQDKKTKGQKLSFIYCDDRQFYTLEVSFHGLFEYSKSG